MNPNTNTRDINADPITGEPGSHPVGTGLGAAGGAAAGAAIGSVGGPVGTDVGGAIGAIVGGLTGKGAAELVDPTVEEAYWQNNHSRQTYAVGDYSGFDHYAPAYRAGYNGYAEHKGRTFEEAEPALESGWENVKGTSKLTWLKAKHASRAAWDRMERAIPGDSDGDGK